MFGKTENVGYNMIMKADVVIIGGGPAGLSAGIFACRAGLDVVLLEKLSLGGQASLSYKIANYPGFKDISGLDLIDKMREAEGLGLKIEYAEVLALSKTKTGYSLKTKNATYFAKKVIIACGCATRKLGLDREKALTGKGVSYCASCDGNFFKNKVVAVVGGGNTAIEDVDYLTKLASKVYLINRTESFRAGEYEVRRIRKYKNVEILTNAAVTKLFGDKQLDAIEVKVGRAKRKLAVEGLFIAIGHEPNLEFVKFNLKLDKFGYIIVDENKQTSEKNLFACGDITSKNFRQIVTACADGAIAGHSCIGEK